MRVAVIGAGVAGLTAAHRLSQSGHACDVYDRWPGLGGQAATLDAGGGVRIERYYHHLFMTDRHIKALCRQLGRQLLLSSDFVRTGGISANPLGRFSLKGVAADQEIFAPVSPTRYRTDGS